MPIEVIDQSALASAVARPIAAGETLRAGDLCTDTATLWAALPSNGSRRPGPWALVLSVAGSLATVLPCLAREFKVAGDRSAPTCTTQDADAGGLFADLKVGPALVGSSIRQSAAPAPGVGYPMVAIRGLAAGQSATPGAVWHVRFI